ncbi:MFS general substrate transporter [Hygrophoropsis aurantiaca]|uniref:MFS general substrate transporter n=1 Tax=Hygrophoropsis aurantiaca TaxID=72124 RepID=A0ACB8A5P0_9AGAM|nr:MFS general substrate transporter [Hygrophoropsis aurantiaca]
MDSNNVSPITDVEFCCPSTSETDSYSWKEPKNHLTELSESEDREFPEGGFAGWVTVLGAFLIQFCSYGYTVSFGVYQEYYARVYLTNESASAISWIGSVNSFLFEVTGLLAGRLYDCGYHLMVGGSLLQSLSVFMLSLTKPGQYYQIFLSQGVLSGCASGLLFIPSVAVVSHYFEKRRALAMTLVSSGVCFGSVIHPIMLNNTLNNSSLGFANSVRVSAGFTSSLLTIGCLLMRTKNPQSKPTANYALVAKRCYKDQAYVIGVAGFTVFLVAYYYPLFYLQLEAETYGLDKRFSFYSLVIMNAASFVGELITGLLSDRFGAANMVVASTFGVSVLMFVMVTTRTVASVVVFGILYGFIAGIFLALWGPVFTALTPDLSELGSAQTCLGLNGSPGCLGTPISGAILTDRYIWWRAAVFNGVVAFAGCALFFGMRLALARQSALRLQLQAASSGLVSSESQDSESKNQERNTSSTSKLKASTIFDVLGNAAR